MKRNQKHIKKIEETETIKTISLKVKDYAGIPIVEAMHEYRNYYNRLSQFINSKLLTMTIGELASLLPEKCKSNKYYLYMTSDEWVNEYVYKMFMSPFNSINCDNIWRVYTQTINPEEYSGNILGIYNNYYRRQGYLANVLGNYRTKFSSPQINVKSKKLSESPTEEELKEQCVYEYVMHNLKTKKDWEEQIKYLEDRGESKIDIIKRIQTLYQYYKENIPTIKEYIERKSIESIVKFGGCVRKEDKLSMTIQFNPGSSNYKVKLNESKNGYTIKFSNGLSFDVYGNRMGLLGGEEIFNIPKKHSTSITFVMRNNSLYVDIPVAVPFSKVINDGEGKTVGIDVNLKHALFVTSEVDNGQFDDYVNVYAELLKDDVFVKVCHKELLDYIKDVSKYVFFAPIELNLLLSRVMKQKGYENVDNYKKLYKVEEAYLRVLDKLQKRFIDEGNNTKRIYIENLKKMRAQMKAYYILKDTYSKYQKDYDIEMGFVDESTESKETMDVRRFENPFRSTDIAQDILKKMNNVGKTVEACRNNIIAYIYKVFENSDFATIVLEKLQSSQMEKHKRIPTVNSLLKYHHVEGHTIEETKEMKIYDVVEKGYYNFIVNEKNEIIDATLTDKGKVVMIEAEFYNLALKVIHFADAKDYFITLSNNGSVNIALVPSQFTSQMDSIRHAIYVTKGKKGKKVIVDKKYVRPKQEKHINGLNGDYNAARNIAYIFENEELREELLKKEKECNKYGKVLYDTLIKFPAGVINKLKKFGDKYMTTIENLDEIPVEDVAYA